MNYEAIEQTLSERIKNIYQEFVAANPLPPFDMKSATKAERLAQRDLLKEYNLQISEAKGRLTTVLNKVRAHRVLLRNKSDALAVREGYIQSLVNLREAIQDGAVLLCFDVERSMPYDNSYGTYPHGELREIGYTIYQNGVMESYNLRSKTAWRRYWIDFCFGATEYMDTEQMNDRILEVAKKADFYVGHSLNMDIGFLNAIMQEKIPHRRVYDTFDLAMLSEEFGEARSEANLANVAKVFGVDAADPHCGGNDARYTMELLLAMIDAFV
jgi:hypothetical protein